MQRGRTCIRSGSDGLRYRVRYTPGLGPGYQPAVVRADRMLPRRRADAAIDAAALATAAGGLRGKARRLVVSHEAVRQAMIAAGLPTGSEDRNSRIRQMAARDVPW